MELEAFVWFAIANENDERWGPLLQQAATDVYNEGPGVMCKAPKWMNIGFALKHDKCGKVRACVSRVLQQAISSLQDKDELFGMFRKPESPQMQAFRRFMKTCDKNGELDTTELQQYSYTKDEWNIILQELGIVHGYTFACLCGFTSAKIDYARELISQVYQYELVYLRELTWDKGVAAAKEILKTAALDALEKAMYDEDGDC